MKTNILTNFQVNWSRNAASRAPTGYFCNLMPEKVQFFLYDVFHFFTRKLKMLRIRQCFQYGKDYNFIVWVRLKKKAANASAVSDCC